MAEVTRKPRKKLATPRPPSSDATKRPILSFRVGADLSEKLRASAEANQTSISEEIERRLTASFSKVEDAATEAVLSLIAANFKAIQSATQSNWVSDPVTQVMCAKSAETIIQAFGSTIAQANDEFNLIRETNRREAEKGGIGAAVLVLETVLHGRADGLAQTGFNMLSEAAEKNEARKHSAILARLLREGAPVQADPEPATVEKPAKPSGYNIKAALQHDKARRKVKAADE